MQTTMQSTGEPDLALPLRLTRIDPMRDMARFYTLSVEVTLFEDWSCTRAFGRIGARGGRVMIGLYPSEAEARDAFARLLSAKRRRGYVDRGSLRARE
jgi:predicted DNA-binding WGR domain protein